MKLEATGFSSTRRLIRDDGSLAALVEKMSNDTWVVFVDEKRVSPSFRNAKKALDWARSGLE
jgi:hypothetical protein